MANSYVHGYGRSAKMRLSEQALALSDILHFDTRYRPGAAVLEAGCGTGAQTAILASNSPNASFTAVDVDEGSLKLARARCARLRNVRFQQSDVRALPFDDESFDHVFMCFLLEHIENQEATLRELRRVIRRGGWITAIEGDHGSVLMHPDCEAARSTIDCQVQLQADAGGDAMVGRRLSPLLRDAGFNNVNVMPRQIYASAARPDIVDSFVRNTFIAMIAGVRDAAIAAALSSPQRFDLGLAGLERTTESDGAFAYTFFKATGER